MLRKPQQHRPEPTPPLDNTYHTCSITDIAFQVLQVDENKSVPVEKRHKLGAIHYFIHPPQKNPPSIRKHKLSGFAMANRDRHRPDLPYHAGQTLTIQRHTPPEPYGLGYNAGSTRKRLRTKKTTDIEFCLRNPPAETPPHHDPTTHTLRLTGELFCKDGRGAQVLRGNLDGEGPELIAKIYDSLYYPYPDDVTYRADQDYSREAASYQEFHRAGVDGTLVPGYYGSWTFGMPLLEPDQHTRRPVRVILIQYVEAESMMSLLLSGEAYKWDPQRRLDLLASAMECKSKLFFHGVDHYDFAPRNVLVSGLDTEKPSVTLIDLNDSVVIRHPQAQYRFDSVDKPESPLYEFWQSCPNCWIPWLPLPHRNNSKVFRGWLMKVWGNGKLTEFASPGQDVVSSLDMGEGNYKYADPLPDNLERDDPRHFWTDFDEMLREYQAKEQRKKINESTNKIHALA